MEHPVPERPVLSIVWQENWVSMSMLFPFLASDWMILPLAISFLNFLVSKI
jgi:hypothetical protein